MEREQGIDVTIDAGWQFFERFAQPSMGIEPIEFGCCQEALNRSRPLASALRTHEVRYGQPFESGWKPLIAGDGKDPKWSHYATNWGSRELKKFVAAEAIEAHGGKLTYFHSIRHTVSQCLGRAKVTAEVAEALLGHSYADSERERYHKLKSDPDQLSCDGIEPGMAQLVGLLDAA
jgi:integrase